MNEEERLDQENEERYWKNQQKENEKKYKRDYLIWVRKNTPKPKVDRKDVSRNDIEIAKLYPIERLVEVHNGVACCIAHDDKRPSMDCRNNFAFCYSCGFHGDVITIYMHLYDVSFSQAVKQLIK